MEMARLLMVNTRTQQQLYVVLLFTTYIGG